VVRRKSNIFQDCSQTLNIVNVAAFGEGGYMCTSLNIYKMLYFINMYSI